MGQKKLKLYFVMAITIMMYGGLTAIQLIVLPVFFIVVLFELLPQNSTNIEKMWSAFICLVVLTGLWFYLAFGKYIIRKKMLKLDSGEVNLKKIRQSVESRLNETIIPGASDINNHSPSERKE